MIPILSIIGKSNSGKTTLIEKLLPKFKTRNIKVGIAKHTSENFNLDLNGTDSHRYKLAGAKNIMLFSKKNTAILKNEPIISIEHSLSYFENIDILIIEGLKNSSWPKIEVFRPEIHKKPIYTDDKTLLAIISNVKLKTKVPQFKTNDISSIYDFIEKKILS